ncbi:Polycomb group protein EMBRYONIC FLOWER 2 [Camellia lanceoleosa]|uniref:Polycomb group protein EMBRYONIC FLOWER 2 n=1 Tax=Camellia lanceoleosa TaxID=1840588 RepID=A0ACC0G9M1_9ERIC|nr:Polycomb group protein EMBRYONIC FLOWER 2 [Camellia lanceoleosa]
MGLLSGRGNLEPGRNQAFAVTSESRASDILLRFHDCCRNYKVHLSIVTEDFSCPFCLVKCASFKVTEDYQAVNVSVKTDICRPEIVANGVDLKQQTFFFWVVLMSTTADISRSEDYFKDLGRGERVKVLAIPTTGHRQFIERVSYLEQVSFFIGKMQVKMLIQRSAGALFGLLFSVWLLLELVDMQFTSTESEYAFIALLYPTL